MLTRSRLPSHSWSAGLFIYQSLDAIDGKQARRTGSSSPLGEVFDHGAFLSLEQKKPSAATKELGLFFGQAATPSTQQ